MNGVFKGKGQEETTMLEYPEVMTISAQLAGETGGKAVAAVLPPTREH